MSDEVIVIGSFATDDDCAHAIEELHRANIHDFRAFSPIPSEKVMEATNEARHWGRSPVRVWVLLGGITGALTGLALTVGTSWEWDIYTGGKPIASIPPFIVIMFELMILTGGLMGLTGFFFHSRLPAFDPAIGYKEHFGADKFGLVVRCSSADAAKLESMLLEAGAENVTREAVQEAA